MNDSLSNATTYSYSIGHNKNFLNNKRKSDSSFQEVKQKINVIFKSVINKLPKESKPVEQKDDIVIEITDKDNSFTESESDNEEYNKKNYYQVNSLSPNTKFNLISNFENEFQINSNPNKTKNEKINQQTQTIEDHSMVPTQTQTGTIIPIGLKNNKENVEKNEQNTLVLDNSKEEMKNVVPINKSTQVNVKGNTKSIVLFKVFPSNVSVRNQAKHVRLNKSKSQSTQETSVISTLSGPSSLFEQSKPSIPTTISLDKESESMKSNNNNKTYLNENISNEIKQKQNDISQLEKNELEFEQKLQLLREQYILKHNAILLEEVKKPKKQIQSKKQIPSEKRHTIKILNPSSIENSPLIPMNREHILKTNNNEYSSQCITQNNIIKHESIKLDNLESKKVNKELMNSKVNNSLEDNQEEEENDYNTKNNPFKLNFDFSNSDNLFIYNNKDDTESTKVEFQSLFFE